MIECKSQIKQLQSTVKKLKATALTMWTQGDVDVAMAREAKAHREKADTRLQKAKDKLDGKLEKEKSDHAETKNKLRLSKAVNQNPPSRNQSGTNQSGGGWRGSRVFITKTARIRGED